MVALMAMFVMGSFGMGTADAAKMGERAQIMDHVAQHSSDCPTMDETGAPMQTGHTACTMTVCCFSEAPDFGALRPMALAMPASYAQPVDAGLTQSEPERAKKPPKHA